MSRRHDWSSLGLPDPDSPAGRRFDWSSLRLPHPNSPVGQHFDYSRHHEWGNTLLDGFMKLPGRGKSITIWSLTELMKHVGANVTIQAELLQHYVGGSAQSYDLGKIPEPWQLWIVNATHGTPGNYAHINGENAQLSGLDDLSDSLGHFTVVVTERAGTKIYQIKMKEKNSINLDLRHMTQEGLVAMVLESP